MTLGVYVTQLSLIWVPLQCVHPGGHTALRAAGAGCRDAYTTSGRREGWPLAREKSQPQRAGKSHSPRPPPPPALKARRGGPH